MPRFDWERARRLYLSGDYERARALLEHAPQPRAAVWLARIDVRQNRYAEAIARLLGAQSDDAALEALREIWLARCYANTREFAMAHALLDRVEAELPVDNPLHFRALHTRALAHHLERDHERGHAVIARILESPDPQDRAQAYALRSWFAALNEDLRTQTDDILRSMAEYERVEEPDQLTFAHNVVVLAVLCRELPIAHAHERLYAACERVAQTSGTAGARFQLHRVVGWVNAMQGDEVGAVQQWQKARKCAPSRYWSVFCEVDRAYYAQSTGNDRAFHTWLSTAHNDASALDWSQTRDEERIILLTLAQLFAPVDPAIAQRYIAQFRSLTTGMDPRIGWVGDRRTLAMQLAPQGLALLHLDERETAISMLREAWEIYTAFDYRFRAANIALTLYQATGDGAWLARAREQAAPWPRSWIGRAMERATAQT